MRRAGRLNLKYFLMGWPSDRGRMYGGNIQMLTEFVISPYPRLNLSYTNLASHIRQNFARLEDVSFTFAWEYLDLCCELF